MLLPFDLYKQPFRLLLPDGRDEYRTFAGGALSILTIIVVLIFAAYEIKGLANRTEYSIKTIKEMQFFKETDEFNEKTNGFVIAAGLSGADGKHETVPPEIGAFKFYRKTYD